MHKRIVLIVFALFIAGVAVFSGCSSNDDENTGINNEILVYGRDTCGNCVYFKGQLDAADIPYVFLNIDGDTDNTAAMWAWVNQADWFSEGSVTLPIVVVNGSDIFSNPSLAQVEAVLVQ